MMEISPADQIWPPGYSLLASEVEKGYYVTMCGNLHLGDTYCSSWSMTPIIWPIPTFEYLNLKFKHKVQKNFSQHKQLLLWMILNFLSLI